MSIPASLAMLAILFAALPLHRLSAQQVSKLTINSESDEGKLILEIEQQTDGAKRQTLLEEFVAKYPKHEGAPWAYVQLQARYLTQSQFEKTLDAGAAALALDPDNLDASYNNLKAAEGKKDAELIQKWALQTFGIARKVAGSKQVEIYCEYALYALALQNSDLAKMLDGIQVLEQLDPRGQYVPKAYGAYLNALRESGQIDKAGTMAQTLAAKDVANEDVLLLAADYNLQKKDQPDKVVLYSTKLVALLSAEPKPEGLPDAEWDKKKHSTLAIANWMAGITYSGMSKYMEADKSLRAALPGLQDEQVRASALFHLGLADYQLGKASKSRTLIQDAMRFSEESAAIKSPWQAQAQKNARSMRGELGTR